MKDWLIRHPEHGHLRPDGYFRPDKGPIGIVNAGTVFYVLMQHAAGTFASRVDYEPRALCHNHPCSEAVN